MAAYKDLVGQKITKVTSNPGEPKTGQMWYNSTSGNLRGIGVLEAWTSSSPLVNAKQNQSGDGTQTAALSVGGNFPSNMADFELYNGTGWSSQTNVPYSAQIATTCGTQTAAITFGGTNPPTPIVSTTIEYDGSSWTTGGSLNTGRVGIAGAGTQTATLACQGSVSNPSPPPSTIAGNDTEEYNGSSWTTVNDTVTTKRNSPAALGTQTAAVGATGGGNPSESPTNTSEEYDGTNWTASATINTSRLNLSGTGTNTAGLIHGGATGPGGGPTTGATEKWDGTSWSNAPSMATARNQKGSRAGSSSAALAFGGYDGSNPSSATEEFTQSINVITNDGFISGADLPSPLGPANKYTVIAAFGNTPALTTAGGAPGAAANAASLNYNGTSWSANPDTNNGAAGRGGAGTQTAGVAFGGVSTFSRVAKTEEWDGSSWTTSGDLNNNRDLMSSAGTQTAALAAGGYTGLVGSLATEEYNGSSWTSGNNINYGSPGVINGSGGGTQTAGWIAGGFSSPSSPVTTFSNHSRYDGTNWTSSTALPTALCDHSSGGTQTAGIVMGGRDDATSGPTYFSSAFTFDGSAWRTTGSLATARREGNRGFCNSSPSSLIAGGYTGSESRATEEFTAGTETTNITDFTTS